MTDTHTSSLLPPLSSAALRHATINYNDSITMTSNNQCRSYRVIDLCNAYCTATCCSR